MRIRVCLLLSLCFLGGAFANVFAGPREPRLIKVLPHLLDANGLHAISPSLLERDAYQAHLRDHPELVSNLRFDVNWRLDQAHSSGLELRVEVRFGKGDAIKTLKATAPVVTKKKRRRGWTSVLMDPEEYAPESQLIAWRVTLWRGEQHIASQTSFLWSLGGK